MAYKKTIIIILFVVVFLSITAAAQNTCNNLPDLLLMLPLLLPVPCRDGAFITGLTLEGARWDDKAGVLEDSKPKELFCPMPVILVRAVTADKETKDTYSCPVYTTEARFREEVFTAQLKSRHSWIKWTMAGVCMFLDVV
jgi:hypothetical protein